MEGASCVVYFLDEYSLLNAEKFGFLTEDKLLGKLRRISLCFLTYSGKTFDKSANEVQTFYLLELSYYVMSLPA